MHIFSCMRQDHCVRTTVDLSAELLRRLRDVARREGITFKHVVNRVLLRGLDAPRWRPRPLPVFSMGSARRDARLHKAVRLAAVLEDEEQLRKLPKRR